MTNWNRWIVAAFIVAIVGVVNQVGANPTFSWQYFNTSAEMQAYFTSYNQTVVASGQFRAGGTTSPEIRVQNGEMNLGQPFDQGNLTWDILGGNNSLSAGFGTPELGGAFQLEATGSGGTTDSANSLPTVAFNQVLIELYTSAAIIDIVGLMNGDAFGISTDPSTSQPEDRYQSVLFTFNNAPGTTPVWEMSADMSMTTPFPGLINDDFRSDITLIQNFEVVPEPATNNIFITQVTNGNSIPTNVTIAAGGSTNITHTADAYYYLEQTVHQFGSTLTTNTYGAGSNEVVETIANVQTNGVITPTFSPYVTTSEQIPHWWLAQHYGHTNDFDSLEGTDTDGDGIDIADEYTLGNNPTVENENFALAVGANTNSALPALEFDSQSNRHYRLVWSTNLMLPFIEYATYTGTGERLTIELTNAPPAFFEVEVTAP